MEEFDIEYKLHQDYPKSNFKIEYPLPGVDVADYYIDQCMNEFNYGDRICSSTYTPYGINGIDSWFTKQIIGGKDKKKLEFMIKRNPHLHNIIKTNLLNNLKQ